MRILPDFNEEVVGDEVLVNVASHAVDVHHKPCKFNSVLFRHPLVENIVKNEHDQASPDKELAQVQEVYKFKDSIEDKEDRFSCD